MIGFCNVLYFSYEKDDSIWSRLRMTDVSTTRNSKTNSNRFFGTFCPYFSKLIGLVQTCLWLSNKWFDLFWDKKKGW